MKKVLTTLFVLDYLAVAALQFGAIAAGLESVGVHWTVSALLALWLCYLPLLGSVAGVYGAILGWGWPLIKAVLLFAGPLSLGLAFMFMAIAIRRKVG